MDFNYLFKALLRKKWVIAFAMVMGFGAGFVFTLFQKKTYLSTAQYSTGITQAQKVKIEINEIFDVNQIDIRFNNVIETFQSEKVLGMVSYELLLHDLESSHPFRKLTPKQKNDTAYKNADFQKVKDILHQKLGNLELLNTFEPEDKKVWDLVNLYEYDQFDLSKKLSVDRVKSSDFLNIGFTSENNELSAFVVNTLGIKFKEFYNSLSNTRTQESLTKIDSLQRIKSKEVDSIQKKLEEFRTLPGANNAGDASAAIAGLGDAGSQLTAEQSRLNGLNHRLISVNEQLSTLNSNATQPATVVKNNNDEYLALREANKILSSQLAQKGGTDPDIQSKIDANQKKMDQVLAKTPSLTTNTTAKVDKAADEKAELIKTKLGLEADIAAANDNIKLYQGQVEEFRKLAFSGGGKEVMLKAIQTDYENARKELDKYNSALFASQDLDVNPDLNFKQILVGQPPIKPQSGKRTLVVGGSAIAMFIIASLWILILELLDSSLRTPSIFQRETKLKLLAVVNKVDLDKKPMKLFFDLSPENSRDQESDIFVESMRKLRFELENSGKKVFLVTSLKSSEGKSTILEALAYTFSMTKKKVLLIDTNFSNNSLTQKFAAKPTLENFNLSLQDNAIDKIWGITTLTDIINTDIIGCNEGNYTPSEVLPKNNLLINLNKIAQHYDFIFMEGAALADHADSKELSKYAEGIITVLSAKNSLGERDKESIQFLKTNTGNKFIGTVLNKVNEDLLEL
jgi:polysaccharide biosynthesis transport protein